MADRMDDILSTVADEADRGVDYAALHDAILAAHHNKKKQKGFARPARMLSYAAAFVALVGLSALALTRGGFLAQPKSAQDYGAGHYMTSEAAPAPTPEEGAVPEMAQAPADAPQGAARNGETSPAPMLITGGSGAALDGGYPVLASEVLADQNAAVLEAGTLDPAPDKSLLGQQLADEYSCNWSYYGVYVEPLADAPALASAKVQDLGNGTLHIYWSASETLHVYAEFIGYTAEDAIALLRDMG